jgi:hypothetical protein
MMFTGEMPPGGGMGGMGMGMGGMGMPPMAAMMQPPPEDPNQKK